jgi:hypothetical protein
VLSIVDLASFTTTALPELSIPLMVYYRPVMSAAVGNAMVIELEMG